MGVETQPEHTHVHSPEEIEILVTESHEGGLLDDEERQLLRNAFRMRDLIARQVMVHRTKIVAASVEDSVVEILNLALDKGHTRIPLYQETADEIIGFVHIKDLFRLHIADNQNLAEILREVVHVPETLPMSEVWETLNTKRQYMAIVFDEFGGTAGIITFEDLITKTKSVMRYLAEFLEIRFEDILLVPTFNKYPIRANTSFEAERNGIMKSTLERYKTLTRKELDFIRSMSQELYGQVLKLAMRFD